MTIGIWIFCSIFEFYFYFTSLPTQHKVEEEFNVPDIDVVIGHLQRQEQLEQSTCSGRGLFWIYFSLNVYQKNNRNQRLPQYDGTRV